MISFQKWIGIFTATTLIGVAGGAAFARETTLLEAFEKALEGNPTIAAMTLRMEQAKERVTQARASYYPSLNVGASAVFFRYSDNDAHAAGIVDQTRRTYDTVLNAKWVIFSGFSRRYRMDSAVLDHQREEALRSDAVRTLLEAVAQSFHRAQLALANRHIAELDAQFYAKQLSDAKIKQQAGKGSVSDGLNFNTRLNQARIESSRYEGEYQVARAALAALLGDDAVADKMPEPVFPDDEEEKEMKAPEPAEYLAHAVQSRPDLAARRLSHEIARANVGSVKARLFPEISLKGSTGVDRTGDPRFETGDVEHTISLDFSYPLYSGGADRAAVREAKAAEAQALLTLKNLENQVASEIRQDCISVISAQNQLLLYRKNAELVKQNRDMVALEYQYGKTSLVNLNEVQNTLNETRQRIALSLISLRQAWYDLKASSGLIDKAY